MAANKPSVKIAIPIQKITIFTSKCYKCKILNFQIKILKLCISIKLVFKFIKYKILQLNVILLFFCQLKYYKIINIQKGSN